MYQPIPWGGGGGGSMDLIRAGHLTQLSTISDSRPNLVIYDFHIIRNDKHLFLV